MSNKKDGSHANNVLQFQSAINMVVSYGSSYRPAGYLSLENLSNTEKEASLALRKVNEYKSACNEATIIRDQLFRRLRPIFKRIIETMEVCRASKERLKDAQIIYKHMQGHFKYVTLEPTEPNKETIKKRIHVGAHKSFLDKAVTLENLILILQKEPNYLPNETELSIPELQTLHSKIIGQIKLVIKKHNEWRSMLLERNRIFYLRQDNLHCLLQSVKRYVKLTYGTASEQYRLIKNITIKKYSNT